MFKNHKIVFLFKLIGLLLTVTSVNAANIIATLDRNPVMLDESFRLVLEADGSVDDDPDFNVLQKDFEILSQSQSTNMSFINGSLSRKGVWNLALMGKKPGTFTIPSIPFGTDRSPALRITVKEATANANPSTGGSEVYVEAEVDQKSTWVQSQIVYTVRLFSRLSMSNLRHGELTTSDADAIIEQLGKPKTFEAFKGGVRFAVRELRYAVYPQHSGELTFSPMVFEGRVNRNNTQSIFDQFMNAGTLKRLRSNSVTVKIKPKPSNIKTSDWIPAGKLTLSEKWSEDVQQLKTGEPVTRTITIRAEGPLAANLPDVKLVDSQGLKQYPDKPLLENRLVESGVSSSKEIKVALIPTRSGDYKLPAVSVAWWNTKKGRREVAHLPEVIITATGSANTAVTPPPVITPAPIETDSEKTTATFSAENNLLHNAGYWPWVSLALAAGWLITLVSLLRQREPRPKTQTRQAPALAPLEKAVRKHGSNNHAYPTKDALLEWAKARWPQTTVASLMDVAELASPELSEQLQVLNKALYSADHQSWDGSMLVKTFNTFRRQKTKHNTGSDNALKPLYKTAS